MICPESPGQCGKEPIPELREAVTTPNYALSPFLDAWYRQVLILATSPGSPMFCVCKSISPGEVDCGPSCNVNYFKKDHLIGLNNSGTNRICWT